MCIVNKNANIYLQKVYIVMSCLCDFSKLYQLNVWVITREKDVNAHRQEGNYSCDARALQQRGHAQYSGMKDL